MKCWGNVKFAERLIRPRISLIAGTSAASVLDGNLLVDMLFSGDTVAVHAMDVLSAYIRLMPSCSENPLEV